MRGKVFCDEQWVGVIFESVLIELIVLLSYGIWVIVDLNEAFSTFFRFSFQSLFLQFKLDHLPIELWE